MDETRTRAFHDYVKSVQPKDPLKPGKILVAIVKHTVSPDKITEFDVIWVKARGKHTLKTIKHEYTNRCPINVEFRFGDEGNLPSDETTVAALDIYGDHFVVIRAVELGSNQATARPAPSTSALTPPPGAPASVEQTPHDELTYEEPTHEKSADEDSTHEEPTNDDFAHEAPSTPQNVIPSIKTATEAMQDSVTEVSAYTKPAGSNLPTPTSAKSAMPETETFHDASEVPMYTDIAMVDQPEEEEDRDHIVPAEALEDVPTIQPHCADRDALPETADIKPVKVEQVESQNVFASADDEDEGEEITEPLAELQALTEIEDPDRLERGVAKAVELLQQLKSPLTDNDTPETQHWLGSLANVEKQAVRTRTIVGVVGNTGAGKSSVINAMLDEERLVPTNCMRACTTVVTELSYNDSENPSEKYKAEIEFIRSEDWKRELNVLFTDLLDTNGEVSRECTNPDTEAGLAYAKIRAVYPHLTKTEMARMSPDALMAQSSVRPVLGTTIEIKRSHPEDFYRQLQVYVDSKEENTGDKGKDKKEKEKRKMEYWPLIKVVKIYTKSAALATGAVIVDLPGVQDSNAARAAVAQGYIKQCSGLWIVAPITRAVDDKSAKQLLGDAFKRQMKYDGSYSAVTFICSKTDDISITEAADSLGLNESFSELYEEEDELDRKTKELDDRIDDLKNLQETYSSVWNDQDELLEKWQDLSDELANGETVYAPSENKKRKRASRPSESRKRHARSNSSWDSDEDNKSKEEASESETDNEHDVSEEDREPLTEEDINAKIEEIKNLKKEARREKMTASDQIKEVRKEIASVKEKRKAIQTKIAAFCISGRNDYSRGAIQTDFALGIRELDQETAAEEDEENFNPDEDERDYDKVARDLPVFCVSSRAYQKLSGRLKKDAAVPGFTDVAETEIPKLQQHCRKLTEAGRASACRRFLNSLTQLLRSMRVWAANDGAGIVLTDNQKAAETRFLKKKIAELEKALEKAVSTCIANVKDVLAENIYEKYAQAIKDSITSAVPTAAGWGAHLDHGGLHWGTYRATVRRSGVFAGSAGPRDFNAELCEPLTKLLAGGWEKTFQRRMPHTLADYQKASSKILRQFHDAIDARVRAHGMGIAGINMLAHQIRNNEQLFVDLAQQLMNLITEQQREANREFTPVIAAAMEAGYTDCSQQTGTGSYMRMKNVMVHHVEEERQSMFRAACDAVKQHLTQMCRDVEEVASVNADIVWNTMRQDYLSIVGGAQVTGQDISKPERKLRLDVRNIIDTSHHIFGAINGGEHTIQTDSADEEEQYGLSPTRLDNGV